MQFKWTVPLEGVVLTNHWTWGTAGYWRNSSLASTSWRAGWTPVFTGTVRGERNCSSGTSSLLFLHHIPPGLGGSSSIEMTRQWLPSVTTPRSIPWDIRGQLVSQSVILEVSEVHRGSVIKTEFSIFSLSFAKTVVTFDPTLWTKHCSVRWYFTEPGCSDPGQSWRGMSLHTAVGRDQFCCDSGHCLPSEMKCDNSLDCPDLSDEANCSLVERNIDGHNLQVKCSV